MCLHETMPVRATADQLRGVYEATQGRCIAVIAPIRWQTLVLRSAACARNQRGCWSISMAAVVIRGMPEAKQCRIPAAVMRFMTVRVLLLRCLPPVQPYPYTSPCTHERRTKLLTARLNKCHRLSTTSPTLFRSQPGASCRNVAGLPTHATRSGWRGHIADSKCCHQRHCNCSPLSQPATDGQFTNEEGCTIDSRCHRLVLSEPVAVGQP
jgi:hypothetical protein